MKPIHVIGLLALAASLMAGCSTVQSTSLVGAVENSAGPTEEKGERKAVLMITVPEPPSVARDQARQAAWRATDYDTDRARDFHAFEPAETCTLPLDVFKTEAGMKSSTGPFIQAELREKEKITVSKTHEVVKRGLLSGEARTETKTLPIYSYWRWPDEQPGYAGEVITVSVMEFAEQPGAWDVFSGTTDDEGRLRIPLAPLLGARALLGKGMDLTLMVACRGRSLAVEVTLPYEVIAYFAQQQQHTL